MRINLVMNGATTVVRKRPPVAAYLRNPIADFDSMIERALAAGEAGRDPEPFLADALRLADDVSWCAHEGHKRDRALDLEKVRHLLELAIRAIRAIEPDKAQGYASSAKSQVRARTCACSKRDLSRSGRPVW